MSNTTFNGQRPRQWWTQLLWLLCLVGISGASVQAHDPGSSAANVRLERDKIVVILNFARAEMAGLVARDTQEKVAAEGFEVSFDGLPMPASEVKVQPGEGGDIQFVLSFPREPALLLTMRSALIGKLNPNHRQMFSLTDEQNRLLASRTLEAQKDSFDFDLAAPPPSTLRQWTTLLIGLALAFGLGAGHALEPGHGKTLVAAYLIGSRGTAAHAIFLGATVTLTHTFGVFLLGLGTLIAARHMDPERLNPWIGLGSGLVIAGIGLSLLIHRWKGTTHGPHPHHHHDHDHAHGHHHDHTHDHGHGPHHEHHHDHAQEGGHPHGHEHNHGHDHNHGHPHTHDHSHPAPEQLHHSHAQEQAEAEHLRAHLPSGQVTWRQLLGLGISGGIVPCPGALTALLGFIAIGRPGYGLLSVVAFSLGLASVLTGIGLLLVQGGRWVQKWRGNGRWTKWLPAISALVITAIGVGIVVQSLASLGR